MKTLLLWQPSGGCFACVSKIFYTPEKANAECKKHPKNFFHIFLNYLLTKVIFCCIIVKQCKNGSLVKRLRHQPLTLKTWVRFPYESPIKCGHLNGVRFLFLGDLVLGNRTQRTYQPQLYSLLCKNVYPTPLTASRLCAMGSNLSLAVAYGDLVGRG